MVVFEVRDEEVYQGSTSINTNYMDIIGTDMDAL